MTEEEGKEEAPLSRRERSQGARNRTKGHDAERHYAALFRTISEAFEKCKTSRQASRLHDDSGIDLCFTEPFNIQIKAGKQKGLVISKELSKIKEEVKKNFPSHYPELSNMNILIHKKEVGRGRRKNEFDEIVSMTLSDFIKLIKTNKI
jgi:hypothetical protein